MADDDFRQCRRKNNPPFGKPNDAKDGWPDLPTLVAGRFEVIKQIGRGSYSVVHLALDKTKNELVALKFEWHHAEKTDKLAREAKLCKVFGPKSPHTTSMFWIGSEDPYNIMAMRFLGPSLEYVFKNTCCPNFTLKTILMIATQMIDCIEFVHKNNIIHRDIKPSNFVLGPKGQRDKIYIVDFGLANRFCDKHGGHIPMKTRNAMIGTECFTTVNLHQFLDPSRRDDLGSIGYVLLYFLRGKLPWQGINHCDKKKRKHDIGDSKMTTAHEQLCEGFPLEFVKYLQYCDQLRFELQLPSLFDSRGWCTSPVEI